MHLQNLVNTTFHYLSVNYLIDFFLWPEWAAFEDLKAVNESSHSFDLHWTKGGTEDGFPLNTKLELFCGRR